MKHLVVNITGKDNHEVWANLIGAVSKACDAKQANDDVWPLMVSSEFGRIEAVDSSELRAPKMETVDEVT